jgi:DHA1 family tetracycline resistance protein-like MFS transporter
MKKKSIGLLFSVVFMDMVGFGFIIPILPDIVADRGSGTAVLGLILASYALGQFISAPIVGRLSDRFGRKPLFMISIFGTFISLILLGTAQSIGMIFFSRILDGLTGGNITVAQSYIGDITTKENRAKGLGMIGAAFGLGFIFGPLFGGLLVNISLYAPALVAAGIAGINLILIATLLPESHPPKARRERAQLNGGGFRMVFRQIGVPQLLSILFFYSLAFSIFQTMFSPHALLVFSLSPQARSYILAYIGVVIAIAQGVLIGALLKRFSERKLMLAANLMVALSLGFWGVNRNIAGLLISMIPLAIGGGLMGVVLRSQLSQSAGEENMGVALGLGASVESFNRILAPAVGAWMLSGLGSWAPGIIGAGLLILPMILLVRAMVVKPRDFHQSAEGKTIFPGNAVLAEKATEGVK